MSIARISVTELAANAVTKRDHIACTQHACRVFTARAAGLYACEPRDNRRDELVARISVTELAEEASTKRLIEA